jgi:hypothetical protein
MSFRMTYRFLQICGLNWLGWTIPSRLPCSNHHKPWRSFLQRQHRLQLRERHYLVPFAEHTVSNLSALHERTRHTLTVNRLNYLVHPSLVARSLHTICHPSGGLHPLGRQALIAVVSRLMRLVCFLAARSIFLLLDPLWT